MNKYPFQIRELSKEDGGGYLITFPDLPGCMSDGDTIEEARKNGSEALGDWIAACKKMGKEIPPPSPPIDPHNYSGKFIQRVPKSVHAQLAKRAETEGVSMNQLVLSYIVGGLAGAGAPRTGDISTIIELIKESQSNDLWLSQFRELLEYAGVPLRIYKKGERQGSKSKSPRPPSEKGEQKQTHGGA